MKLRRIILLVIGLVSIGLALGAGFVTVRHAVAAGQVEKEWVNTQVDVLENVGTTHKLTILPLIEKRADTGLKAEWGVAYLIKTDTSNILFDVGQNADGSAPLLSNMAALNVTPDDFDLLFFSHPHPDHLGGMAAMLNRTFSFGGPVKLDGKPVYGPIALTYPGTTPTVAREPAVLAPGVATTGTIAFAEVFPMFIFNDPNLEQSLLVNVDGVGVIVIAGCGHPGIQKMMQRADDLFDEPVVGFVGGLHYPTSDGKDIQPNLDFLKTYNPVIVAPSPHDSSQAALDAIHAAFPEAYRDVMVGQEIAIGAAE